MIIITITASKSDGTLELSDRGKSNVNNGEEVQWHIANNSGVDSITSIGMKPPMPAEPSTDIFSDPPHQLGNSRNWKGTVSETAANGDVYNYFIKWLADDGSGEHTFDPKLKVNSR